MSDNKAEPILADRLARAIAYSMLEEGYGYIDLSRRDAEDYIDGLTTDGSEDIRIVADCIAREYAILDASPLPTLETRIAESNRRYDTIIARCRRIAARAYGRR